MGEWHVSASKITQTYCKKIIFENFLNDIDHRNILQFNKILSQETQRLICHFLFCLKETTGHFTADDTNLALYVDADKLFAFFKGSKDAQQYIRSALSQLNEIGDMLDDKILTPLASSLNLSKGNLLEKIKKTVLEN